MKYINMASDKSVRQRNFPYPV